jgi:hypothetical protein
MPVSCHASSSSLISSEPAFSPDGKHLYFSSSKGMTDISDYSIWRVKKTGNSWSNPRKVIDIEAPNKWEFHPAVTGNTVYFCSWNSDQKAGSIYKSF